MKRVLLITVGSMLAVIAWGILTRHDVAFGGELIVPALALLYAVTTEAAR